jgi:hypothetical protein
MRGQKSDDSFRPMLALEKALENDRKGDLTGPSLETFD